MILVQPVKGLMQPMKNLRPAKKPLAIAVAAGSPPPPPSGSDFPSPFKIMTKEFIQKIQILVGDKNKLKSDNMSQFFNKLKK